MKNFRLVNLLLLGAFFFVPAAAMADSVQWTLSQETVAAGSILPLGDVEVHIPPSAFAIPVTASLEEMGDRLSAHMPVRFPRDFRSRRALFRIHFSVVPREEVTVRLQYHGTGEDDEAKRILFLADGAATWQPLRTHVDKHAHIMEAHIPMGLTGTVVAAKHRWKKEAPIRADGFVDFPGTPYSRAGAVIEVKSGKFLYREDARRSLSLASVTKLMTVHTFLQEQVDLEASTSYQSIFDREGATIPLVAGDQLRWTDVLMGALVPSANNMAVMLASTAPSMETFVERMNATAQEWGMGKTHFVEPSGLDGGNVSSAGNLARWARKVFVDAPDLFFRAANAGAYSFSPASSSTTHTIYSTNKFDGKGIMETTAFKTGYLPGIADRTLVVQVREIATGHEVLIVLLGNPEYGTIFQEAYDLAAWSFRNWDFHNYE